MRRQAQRLAEQRKREKAHALIDRAHVDALRVEEGEKLDAKMKRTREREAQLAAEAEDDEIVFSDEVSSQMPCSPLERVLMPRLPLGLPT